MTEPNIPAIFDVMAQAAEKMGCHLMDVITAVNRAKGLDGTAAGYRITLQIIEHWQAVRSTVRWYPPREDEIADLRDKLAQAEHIELLARAVETFLG